MAYLVTRHAVHLKLRHDLTPVVSIVLTLTFRTAAILRASRRAVAGPRSRAEDGGGIAASPRRNSPTTNPSTRVGLSSETALIARFSLNAQSADILLRLEHLENEPPVRTDERAPRTSWGNGLICRPDPAHIGHRDVHETTSGRNARQIHGPRRSSLATTVIPGRPVTGPGVLAA
jgi:hypothetical protein